MEKIKPNPFPTTADDKDHQETQEWLEALGSVFETEGPERARFLLDRLEREACNLGLAKGLPPYSAYRNSIPVERQPPYPGDLALEQKITGINRWNALAMVVKANRAFGGLGGHIASYASAAEIFEVGFNHFFRGKDSQYGADLVYFQPPQLLVYMPGLFSKIAYKYSTWNVTDRKREGKACLPILIPG